MRSSILGIVLTALCAPAFAAIDTYTAFLYGANEVGSGDADGFGVATLAIDNVGSTASWSILALNVDLPLTGAHIHSAAAGINGPVIVDFSGSVIGSGLFDTDLASITPLSSPNFYINIHNAFYPAGAIRGQLQYVGTSTTPIPEPSIYALMFAGIGLLGFLSRRRASR